eukprot:TRINITY_DN32862_c0_g1_i1.p1 TRINITY_DN32862_c0_g1~~TRINITY_DN32862_c0_g1_i1.p1  ORF type:complete len:789 (-),score=149.69 TRINITY_DN32862_c0_g1_i1:65-2431(-)
MEALAADGCLTHEADPETAPRPSREKAKKSKPDASTSGQPASSSGSTLQPPARPRKRCGSPAGSPERAQRARSVTVMSVSGNMEEELKAQLHQIDERLAYLQEGFAKISLLDSTLGAIAEVKQVVCCMEEKLDSLLEGKGKRSARPSGLLPGFARQSFRTRTCPHLEAKSWLLRSSPRNTEPHAALKKSVTAALAFPIDIDVRREGMLEQEGKAARASTQSPAEAENQAEKGKLDGEDLQHPPVLFKRPTADFQTLSFNLPNLLSALPAAEPERQPRGSCSPAPTRSSSKVTEHLMQHVHSIPAGRRLSPNVLLPIPGRLTAHNVETGDSGGDDVRATVIRADLPRMSQSAHSALVRHKASMRSSGFSGMSSRISGHLARHWPETCQRTTHLLAKIQKGERANRLWTILEVPESSKWARMYARLMTYIILASVFLTYAYSLEPTGLPKVIYQCQSGLVVATLETLFDVIFTAEFLTRLWVCPAYGAFRRSPYNVIDGLCAIPLFIRAAVGFILPLEDDGSVEWAVLICVLPVLRLLKTLRYFQQFHLLLSAFRLALEALPVLLFTLLVLVMSFSAAIYIAEPRENIHTVGQAIWLSTVTMGTVGYGDLVPKSTAGFVVVSALIVSSAMFMAIPLGIVGSSFSRVWEDRDRLLLIHRTRLCLIQAGYGPRDVQVLFRHFGNKMTGELGFEDFRNMLEAMCVGIDAERTQQLFRSFDEDGSGAINDIEFVRQVFPQCSYKDLCDTARTLDDQLSYMQTLKAVGSQNGSLENSPRGSRQLPGVVESADSVQ